MIHCIRTDSSNRDFQKLVSELDAYLAVIDGEDHAFYAQYNKTGDMKNVVVAYEKEKAVGCGAFKEYKPDIMEVKRMYVLPAHREKGIASLILKELENWCAELGCKKCILETGKKQKDAIALYQKKGYKVIPNFGQYKNIGNSICFEKKINMGPHP